MDKNRRDTPLIMKKYTWNDALLSSGNKTIDHQHQLFVKNYNDIADLANSGEENREEFVNRLAKLLVDLKEHFKMEERELKNANSAYLSHHIKEHKVLYKKLNETLDQANTLEDIFGLLEELYQWMDTHLELEATEFRQL